MIDKKKVVGYPVVSNSNIRNGHFSSKRAGPGKGAVAAADSSPSFSRALRITGKPQFLQPRLARWCLQLLYAICTVSCSLHIPRILLPAVRAVCVTSGISRRSLSLLPGDRTGTTLQEMHLHQETPLGIRHTVTSPLLSFQIFVSLFTLPLYFSITRCNVTAAGKAFMESARRANPTFLQIFFIKPPKLRVYHKINLRMACENAFNWVQAEPVHNRSMMQN